MYYVNGVIILLLTFLLPVILIVIDQISKFLATQYLMPIGSAPLIPGIIELRYILNDGAAFSLFSGNRFLLIGVTSTALLALLVYLVWKKPENKLEYFSWLLVLSGGIGNLIDRILNGVVVDFFSFQFVNFAIFNVADIYVTCGVALLFVSICYGEYKISKEKKLQKLVSQQTVIEPDKKQQEGKNDEQN